MEDQLGALGIVLNCLVLWNTVYIDEALRALRAQGYQVRDDDVARLSPFIRKTHQHARTLFVLSGRTRVRSPAAARPRGP
jgi:Tn3 transposase DDE domain